MHKLHESFSNISLEELTAFAAVAETGSFRGAAQRLGRDATVISRRISHLEMQLGVLLLSRTTRRVSLTEVGGLYHQRVRSLLDEFESANRAASNFAASAQGLLRVSLPVAFGRLWIAPLLPQFLSEYSDIRLDARYVDRFVDVVAEGFDVAIRVGALRDSTLRARKIASFHNVLVASPAYVQINGHPMRPEDLQKHDCLVFVKSFASADWILKKETEEITIRPSGRLSADNSETLLTAAKASLGIALLPDWLCGALLRSEELVEILPEWRGSDAGEIYAVMPPGQLVPTKTRVFVEEITQAIQKGWR